MGTTPLFCKCVAFGGVCLLVLLVLICAGVVCSPLANPLRHCRLLSSREARAQQKSRDGAGAHPRAAAGDSLVLLVLDLGVADLVLLFEHLGHVIEVLFDQRCKVRVMDCRTLLANQ